MDKRKYEDDGNYAAQVDFNISPGYLLDAITSAYEAAVSTGVSDTFDSSTSWKWGLNYLETGLALLGFKEVAELVKVDFSKSTQAFAERLNGQTEKAPATALSKKEHRSSMTSQ